MIQFERHGIRWEAPTPCEPLLDKLIADPGHAIKVTPTKLVTVHTVESRTYYVKRYRNTNVPLRPLKFFFKPSEARNEWNIAQRYQELGIPLVHHLALGERWTATGLQESLLITEGYDGVPLSKTDVHQTEPVQMALARLLRLMHDRGVLQPDLHHNILVRAEPLELRRIDVDRGELKSTLTDDERSDNLAWLNVNVPLSDKFFEVYGANPGFIRQARQRSDVMRRESRAKFSWRSVGDNLRFEPKVLGGMKWWVRKEFFDEKLQRILENPDQPTDDFMVQRFEACGWTRWLGESAAHHAYRTAYHLELLGIPTPRPIASSNRFVVTERIAGAVSLGEYLKHAARLEETVITGLAALAAQLHAEGFSAHGRLSTQNFLVSKSGGVFVVHIEDLSYLKQVDKATRDADVRSLIEAIARIASLTRAEIDAFFPHDRPARS